jgi:NAD(P)H dehydrogenase (quinone)
VLTSQGHGGAVYELGGDDAFTMSELAEAVSRESGRTVQYRDLPEAEYEAALVGFGIPEPDARMLADSDTGLARGELFTESRDLHRLIGRPTTPLRDAITAALRG